MKSMSQEDPFRASSPLPSPHRPRITALSTLGVVCISSAITALLTTSLLTRTASHPLASLNTIKRPFSFLCTTPQATSSTFAATPPEPFQFPLENGFPFPTQTALEELWTTAGGNFSNGPLAGSFSDDSLTDWKLQAFNEFFEVAFFTQLIRNITNRVSGFELEPDYEEYILGNLKQIQAQEQLHAFNANDAVHHFAEGGSHMYPCAYVFPGVNDFRSAILLAQSFTDMYLGLLTDISRRTAADLGAGGSAIVYVLAQAIGQEGQQSGWFRALLGKHASAEPFLSPGTRDLHFSWLQRFLSPGSCPNITDVPLQIFKPLELGAIVVGHESITLKVPGTVDPTTQRIAYVNGALVPSLVPFKVTSSALTDSSGALTDSTEITADFPFARNVMHGMTIAAIVEDGPDFVSALDVANATIYGPVVIEVA